jgi:hypothetical protein
MDKELPLLPYKIRPYRSWIYNHDDAKGEVTRFWAISSGRFVHHVRYSNMRSLQRGGRNGGAHPKTHRWLLVSDPGHFSTYRDTPKTLSDSDGSWVVSLSQIVEGRRIDSSMINSPLTISSVRDLILLATGYPIAPFQYGRTIKFWEHPASLLKELNNVE